MARIPYSYTEYKNSKQATAISLTAGMLKAVWFVFPSLAFFLVSENYNDTLAIIAAIATLVLEIVYIAASKSMIEKVLEKEARRQSQIIANNVQLNNNYVYQNRRKHCRFCGEEINEDSIFCEFCGKKLK